MTTTPLGASSARLPRAAALLAAALVAAVADLLVAAGAVAAGADPSYPPLTAPVLIPFSVLGLAAGLAGWAVVRRAVARPARVLAVLVPAVVVLSWIPDVLVAPGIPGATTTGVVALAVMHVVVAAVGVPVYRRVAPVGGAAEAGR